MLLSETFAVPQTETFNCSRLTSVPGLVTKYCSSSNALGLRLVSLPPPKSTRSEILRVNRPKSKIPFVPKSIQTSEIDQKKLSTTGPTPELRLLHAKHESGDFACFSIQVANQLITNGN